MSMLNRVLLRNCYNIQFTKPVFPKTKINFHCTLSNNGICCRTATLQHDINQIRFNNTKQLTVKQYTTKPRNDQSNAPEPPAKPGLVQRFKQMYRDYWYVVLPVHGVTSVLWFGGFYYIVRSGVDVIAMLEWMGISDKIIEPLKDSKAGYVALTFACYKIASPLRYAVTVGGTTIAIKRLTALGWIKPVPSKERIKEMFQEKKDNFQDRFQESKQHYQTQMKEKKTQMLDEMRRYKNEMREMKNKVKKT